MTQITHDEARRLIQSNTDHVLDQIKQSLLDAHLKACQECNSYARELEELENALRGAMQRKWNLPPAPVRVYTVIARAQNRFKGFPTNLVVTRTAAITLAIFVMMFGAWHFSRTKSTPSEMLTFALPVPTPSTYSYLTSTGTRFQGCSYILYQVMENDSLESIALQYGVTKADIMQLNDLKTETLHPSTQVRIPVCNSTATGTSDAPTGTITITPQFEGYTSTPG